jgi:putative ABC transport system substrate-binding protein
MKMQRRAFIGGLGATATWPLAARAQLDGRVRRVGVLVMYPESNSDGRVRISEFVQGVEKLGWTVGRNLAIDYGWGNDTIDSARTVAAQLLRLAPDLILANGSAAVAGIQQITRSVPIVFVGVSEPVAQGFVASLARPGGNMTGFSNLEPTVGPKWLEMLKEIAPHLTRVAVMINPDNSGSLLFAHAAMEVANKFGVDMITVPVRTPAEIEAAVATLGREPGGGLIIPPNPFTSAHSKLIVDLAGNYRLPTISAVRLFPDAGGLMSYGASLPGQFRQSAAYVDRILRGEKPADLPVQQPTKFEMVINMKTARALGLTVPNTLLVSADEVIE